MKQATRRMLAHGTNASLVTIMVVGVLVMVYALSDAYRWRVDLSAEAVNTLQPDTVQKLRLLDQDGEKVVITAFTHQRGKDESFFKDRSVKDLLREIGEQSTVVEWRLVDFDKERLTAEALGATAYGRVVIQRGKDRVDLNDREMFRRAGKGRTQRYDFVGEAALSRAFSQLMTPSRRAIYMLSGHGEIDPQDQGPSGMSELVGELDRERYDVEKLDLLRSDREGALPTVPDDAALVFLARPKQPLTAQEEDALLAWVSRGGSVLIAVDVGQPVPDLLGRVGITVPDGVALQPEMQVPYRDRPIPQYRTHSITAALQEDGLPTVLAHPAPLLLAESPPAGVRSTALLQSTRGGWIDRGGAVVGGGAVYEPEIDGEGPVVMAAAVDLRPGSPLVRSGKPQGRLVAIGDGDLFTNALIGETPGNGVFAVNVVHWLAREDRRLGATVGTVGKAAKVRRLALTQEDLGRLRWLSLGLLPLLVGLLGFGALWSRRGR